MLRKLTGVLWVLLLAETAKAETDPPTHHPMPALSDVPIARDAIDVRLGPHRGTLVAGRLPRSSIVIVKRVTGDGEWIEIYGFSRDTGGVSGWVRLEDLRTSGMAVPGQHVPKGEP